MSRNTRLLVVATCTCLLGGALMVLIGTKQISGSMDHVDGHKASTFTFGGRTITKGKPEDVEPTYLWEGHPLRFMEDKPLISRAHCISENFQRNSWIFRSCQFDNLCFDQRNETFMFYPSKHHQRLETMLYDKTFLSSVPKDVISGGQHAKWIKQGRGRWRPTVVSRDDSASESETYFVLPDDIVWVSFFPHGACNVGHIVWDSFLPIYTLLEVFGLLDKKLFLTKTPGRNCATGLQEWSPLMGVVNGTIKNTHELDPLPGNTSIVCTKKSVSGMGFLSDHGFNRHGSLPSDFLSPVNVGRGPNLLGFRNFMLRNIGVPTTTRLKKPFRITFSILSSREAPRRQDFAKQIRAAETLGGVEVAVHAMWNYTVKEQVEIATQTSIFVSTSGGGTGPAFFLPKGASLIIYVEDTARLDWDMWNAYSSIRVHWLNIHALNNNTDLLLQLIQDEIETLDSHSTR